MTNMEVSQVKMDAVQKADPKPVEQAMETTKRAKVKDDENKKKLIEQSKEHVDKKEQERVSNFTIEQDKLRKIMETLKEQMPNSEPRFGVHEATKRMVIRMVDKDTQKVVREYPLEKTLDQLAKNMEIAGALLDKKM